MTSLIEIRIVFCFILLKNAFLSAIELLSIVGLFRQMALPPVKVSRRSFQSINYVIGGSQITTPTASASVVSRDVCLMTERSVTKIAVYYVKRKLTLVSKRRSQVADSCAKQLFAATYLTTKRSCCISSEWHGYETNETQSDDVSPRERDPDELCTR